MRRALLGVVAVVARAPLAAVAPASAAVQHPAVALDSCNGNWVYVQNYVSNSNFATSNYVGSWHVDSSSSVEASGSTGEVEDSYSRLTEFCATTYQTGWNVFRQQGTSDCATWDLNGPPHNTVQMEPCSPTDVAAQNWAWDDDPNTEPYTLTTIVNQGASILGGTGGDTAVYMAGFPPNNLWDLRSTSDSCNPACT
jgi:hypothetical protein